MEISLTNNQIYNFRNCSQWILVSIYVLEQALGSRIFYAIVWHFPWMIGAWWRVSSLKTMSKLIMDRVQFYVLEQALESCIFYAIVWHFPWMEVLGDLSVHWRRCPNWWWANYILLSVSPFLSFFFLHRKFLIVKMVREVINKEI